MSRQARSPSSKAKGSQLNPQKPELALLNKSGKEAYHKSSNQESPAVHYTMDCSGLFLPQDSVRCPGLLPGLLGRHGGLCRCCLVGGGLVAALAGTGLLCSQIRVGAQGECILRHALSEPRLSASPCSPKHVCNVVSAERVVLLCMSSAQVQFSSGGLREWWSLATSPGHFAATPRCGSPS